MANYSVSERRFDKSVPYALSILITYVVLKSIFVAATTPFWYDEILTLVLARRPSFAALVSALKTGMDGQPPAFYLVERLFVALVPNEHIAFRLPSIIAFACLLICVFIFVRTRNGRKYALVCTAVLLLTPLHSRYATEARPYSLFAACVALALVCYQRAPAAGWVLLMSLSLGLAECFHYYAVFALIPFMAAEVVLSLQTRRLRWIVWLGIFCGFVPLAASWRILAAVKAHVAAHFWSPPTFHNLGSVIGAAFHGASFMGIAVAAIGSVASFAAIAVIAERGFRGDRAADPFAHERVLAIALLNLPIMDFIAARITHGGFVGRYAVPALLAVPLLIAYILPRLQPRSVTLLAFYLAFLISTREAVFWISGGLHPVGVLSPDSAVEALVSSVGYSDLPVVFSSGLDYLPIAYYAPPDWARRFVAVVDPPQAVVYAGSDNLDTELITLKSYLPLQVEEFPAFASEHPVFLLYSGEQIFQFDWWPARLRHDGDSLQELATAAGKKIYLVTVKSH